LPMSRAGGVLAATVFSANPFLGYLGSAFNVELAVFSWLPWMALCAYRASVSTRRAAWVSAGALVTAMAWLAGQAQLWAYCVAAVLVCTAGFARERRARAVLLASLSIGLGVLLVLFQVVPFVHLVAQSQRTSKFTLEQFLIRDVPLASWPTLFV